MEKAGREGGSVVVCVRGATSSTTTSRSPEAHDCTNSVFCNCGHEDGRVGYYYTEQIAYITLKNAREDQNGGGKILRCLKKKRWTIVKRHRMIAK